MSLFIANAWAQDGAAAQGGGMELIFMLAMFAVIFYFMVYRPQAKRVKDHKTLVSSLKKGEEVLTNGGLVGKIVKVTDEKDFVIVALAENLEVTVQKGAISALLPKGTMKSL
ncbi:preprotein translocase subunit YajC [Echinimonas agarilytica]|uniref:Sec translocon accessory complex subunit YajC n=1 Tax=Echinimonas agarilytica TaxID=1215918 RepID=A0AA41W7S5_9GAMM|nr:preprotein translocase subunit YajC [Echinimonas agarilytica]MCM2680158.1 preprotein translocase subunit YajC [Echinimonas agarilytica]